MGRVPEYPIATIVTGEENLTGVTSGEDKQYQQFPLPLLAQQIQVEALDLGITTHNTLSNITIDTTLDTEKGLLVGNSGGWNIDAGVTLTIKSKLNVFENKQLFFGDGDVRFETGSVEKININWFGAVPNSGVSAVSAIRKTIDTAINSEGNSIVYFPEGSYLIDAPIYPRYYNSSNDLTFYNLTLEGAQPVARKNDGKGGVSLLEAPNEIPFIFGLQGCRGVTIKNLAMEGYILSPEKGDLVEKTEEELLIQYTSQTSLRQYAPLGAIVIDPLMDNNGVNLPDGYEHPDLIYDNSLNSSRVLIEGCFFSKFPTAIAFSPNGTTQQGDSIKVTNCVLKDGIMAIVTCQDQARTLITDNIDMGRYKWCFVGDIYGAKSGIIPEVNSVKISDGTAWIFRYNGTQSYGHFSNVYAEGLYGIGYCALNYLPVGLINCTLKHQDKLDASKGGFVNPCILYTDNATLIGCTISIGGASTITEPLVMSVDNLVMIGCYLDTPVVNIGSNINAKFNNFEVKNTLRASKIPYTTWSVDNMVNQTTETIVYAGEVLDSSASPVLLGDDLVKSTYTIPVSDTSIYAEKDFVFARVEDMPLPIGSVNTNTILGQIIIGGIVADTSVTIYSNLLPQSDIDLRVVSLGVPDKTSVSAELTLGSWNMDANTTEDKLHELSATEWLTVRNITATVHNDDDVIPRKIYPITRDGFIEIDDTNFILTRNDGGFFDSVDFNGSGSRGFINFDYIPD